MRKPLVALGLALSAGLGVVPVADTLAATPASYPQTGSNPGNSSPLRSNVNHSANAVSGAAIVQTALQYIGYPYTATGNSPSTGFSCIGFVSFVYRQNGIPLPGDLGNAIAFAPSVPFSDLMPGDILYFGNTVWAGLSHAAIYLGGGRFVHAEWYGKGVRITSFNNDPADGNYWPSHYLGANRPWAGAAIGSVTIPPAPPGPRAAIPNGVPGTQAQTIIGGTQAIVNAPSLNVRSGPAKRFAAQTVLRQGTAVTVIGHRRNWSKVQLADGSIGWVQSSYIGQSATPSTTVTGANGALPTVGNPTAPTRSGFAAPVHVRNSATAHVIVNGLRVHSSPSVGAPVVNTVSSRQRLQVLARGNGWVKVRTPDGTVGWISAAYTSVRRRNAVPSVSTATYKNRASRQSFPAGLTARVAVNVRTQPSLSGAMLTTLPAGGSYRVLGWSSGWAHVQLSNGATGWVSGSVIGRSASPTYRSYRSTRATRPLNGGSVLSAGVRVHSGPGVNAPVVGLAAAGARVRVLGYRGGWALIRLTNGQTGYVLGSYVR